jgi:hypothetical protein
MKYFEMRAYPEEWPVCWAEMPELREGDGE